MVFDSREVQKKCGVCMWCSGRWVWYDSRYGQDVVSSLQKQLTYVNHKDECLHSNWSTFLSHTLTKWMSNTEQNRTVVLLQNWTVSITYVWVCRCTSMPSNQNPLLDFNIRVVPDSGYFFQYLETVWVLGDDIGGSPWLKETTI